jgi:hypothetical protein
MNVTFMPLEGLNVTFKPNDSAARTRNVGGRAAGASGRGGVVRDRCGDLPRRLFPPPDLEAGQQERRRQGE